MPKCNNCGAFVSGQFYRVFSNNYGELWGCLDCGTQSAGHRRALKNMDNTGTS